MRESNALALVESAYRLVPSDEEWLSGIAANAERIVEGSIGANARLVRLVDDVPTGTYASARVQREGFDEAVRELERSAFQMPAVARMMRSFGRLGATTTSDAAIEAGVPLRVVDSILAASSLGGFGMRDALNLFAQDTNGDILAVGVGLSRHQSIPRSRRPTWNRVAVHLVAAMRLRRSLRAPSGSIALAAAAAIIDPAQNRVVHLADPELLGLKARVRAAALGVDRARRGSMRSNALEALELWRGLFDGRWSIFDAFDTDGRRFLVAHANEPRVAEDRRLTRRERQVVAMVGRGTSESLAAYGLGLSVSTVRTHLARALRKLGLSSARMLVDVAAQLGPAPG